MFFDIKKEQKNKIKIEEANQIILSLQPIPIDNVSIWKIFERYLIHRLYQDKAMFINLLKNIVKVCPNEVLSYFQEEKFNSLVIEIKNAAPNEIITNLLFSETSNIRRFGCILFQKIKIDSFAVDIVKKIDEKQLRLVLLEYIHRPFLGEETSRFFLMLEPIFRSSDEDLRKEFEQEMINQAINYPGECLERWSQIKNPSDLIKKVIESSGRYFENLRKTNSSPAVSFTFPEFFQSMAKSQRESSKKINESSKKNSIVSMIAKHVDIIYGSQCCQTINGKIGDPSQFKEISHSIEFPRLELIDPEGAALKRMETYAEIKKIEKN